MEHINRVLSGTLVPVALALCALFFLCLFKGKPMSRPKAMLRAIFKKKSGVGTSPVRAVIFALAGTLGVGNIVGVASAIALGGAGAVFWMWISAILAMILKYSEVLLAVRHRRVRGGEYYGGAVYYIKDCFTERNRNKTGALFAFVFLVLCLANGFSMGCVIQSNAISNATEAVFGLDKTLVGVVVAILSVVVFFLNGKGIFALCEKLVPFVSAGYILMSLAVIILSWDRVPTVLAEIIEEAFSSRSAGGGALGFLVSRALRYGTIRGLFSNEAGCGTAPTAHATSNTTSPCEQGFLGIVEVFIDTILVCTMTALVILLNPVSITEFSDNPIMMALSAFSAALGDASGVFLCVAVFLFAFATIICWGYYGKECIYYLNKSRGAERAYYFMYVIFVFVGSFIKLDAVWQIADFAVGAMTLMNLFVLFLMRSEIKKETNGYFILNQ